MSPATARPKLLWRYGVLRSPGLLGWAAIAVALGLMAPIIAVVTWVFGPSQGTWAHLASTVLPEYVSNTLWLVLGVAYGVISIGVLSAWLVTTFRFPGRSLFEWALVLPLAMPAYVMAYAYTDWLQFSGPVQTALRNLTGWKAGGYWFPEVRSLPGAMAMFSFVLYPYVYLLARTAFLEQSVNLMEAGRLLGRSVWGTFFRVALPLARPGIAAGTALALMETLADFGTVSYFAVPTFTTGIYRAWLGMGDVVAAAQLSALLLALVAAIMLLERWNRGGAKFFSASARRQIGLHPLRGAAAWIASLACLLPIVFGFLLPSGVLLTMTLRETDPHFGPRFFSLITNSFTLAGVTALAAIGIAVLMAYAARLSTTRWVTAANRIAGLGYAMPGAVIAVGIMIPVGRFDNALSAWLEAQFGIETGLLLSGTVLALVYAYLVRFLAVALQTVEAGLSKITPSMDEAARGFGYRPGQTLVRVHVPILWSSLLTAGLLVFVDVMKELPITFAMRPFNFDTLAVQAFNLASDERLAEAATASLVIVAVGLIPVIILSRGIARSRK